MFTSKKTLTLSAIAATLLSGAAFADIQANIKIINANNLKGSDDVHAMVSYHNDGSEDMKMLSYLMKPNKNGDLEEDIFNIKFNGEDLAYKGRHVKRGQPTAADYVTIKPGQTVRYSVELSGAYDLQASGDYSFQYKTSHMNLFADQPMINQKAAIQGMDGVTSNIASSFIAQAKFDYLNTAANKGKPCNPRKQDCGGGTDPEPDPSGVTFTGSCSSGEQSDLISALGAAKNMANDSVSSLNGSASTRYNTWFGAYSSSRHNTVAGNFDSIKDALDNKPLTFDCSCNQSYFAYVYPNQPYKVYFCKAFWAANETGTDSRGGTIIHEMSHFNAVAGTDDIVYGQSGAKNLANTNPADAIQNADSHEYFAENNPHQN